MPPDGVTVEVFEKAFEKLEKKKKLELEMRKIDGLKRTIEGIVTQSKKTQRAGLAKKIESTTAKSEVFKVTEEIKLQLLSLNQKNVMFKAKISGLEATQKNVGDECRRLHTLNEEMQAKMVLNEKKMLENNQNFEEMQMELTQKIDQHEAQIVSTEQEKRVVEAKNEKLIEKEQGCESASENLRKEIKRNENMLKEIKKENKQLKEEIENGETEKKKGENQLLENEKQNQVVLTEKENLEISLKTKTEQGKKILEEKKSLEFEFNELVLEKQKNDDVIGELRKEIKEAAKQKELEKKGVLKEKTKIGELEQKIAETESQKNRIEETISKMRKSDEELQQKLEKAVKNLASIETKEKKAKEEHDSLKSRIEDSRRNCDEEIDKVKKAQSQKEIKLEKELGETTKYINSLNREYSNLKIQKEDLERNLRTAIEENKNVGLATKIKEKGALIETLQDDIRKKGEKISVCLKDFEISNQNLENIQKDLQSTKLELETNKTKFIFEHNKQVMDIKENKAQISDLEKTKIENLKTIKNLEYNLEKKNKEQTQFVRENKKKLLLKDSETEKIKENHKKDIGLISVELEKIKNISGKCVTELAQRETTLFDKISENNGLKKLLSSNKEFLEACKIENQKIGEVLKVSEESLKNKTREFKTSMESCEKLKTTHDSTLKKLETEKHKNEAFGSQLKICKSKSDDCEINLRKVEEETTTNDNVHRLTLKQKDEEISKLKITADELKKKMEERSEKEQKKANAEQGTNKKSFVTKKIFEKYYLAELEKTKKELEKTKKQAESADLNLTSYKKFHESLQREYNGYVKSQQEGNKIKEDALEINRRLERQNAELKAELKDKSRWWLGKKIEELGSNLINK